MFVETDSNETYQILVTTGTVFVQNPAVLTSDVMAVLVPGSASPSGQCETTISLMYAR